MHFAARHQAHRRKLNAFLKQFARLRVAGAGDDAAEVALVRDAAGKRDEAVAVEHRRDHGHVHRMRYAADVGAVRDKRVARMDIVPERRDDRPNDGRHAADMQRQHGVLADHLAAGARLGERSSVGPHCCVSCQYARRSRIEGCPRIVVVGRDRCCDKDGSAAGLGCRAAVGANDSHPFLRTIRGSLRRRPDPPGLPDSARTRQWPATGLARTRLQPKSPRR